MKCMGYVFIFVLSTVAFLFPESSDTSIRFDHISLAEGLSQSTVYCIFQDSRGFMWFGTEDGLNKYDGYTFTFYKCDPRNPYSLSNNFVIDITENLYNGDLWIGTWGGGLNRLDRKSGTIEPFKHVPNDSTSLASNDISALFIDSRGRLWIGTHNGLDRYDQKTGKFIHHSNNPNDPSLISDNMIKTICEDNQGYLWIGTRNGGLNRFEPQTGQFLVFQHQENDPTSLIDNNIIELFLDHKGSLWVGTNTGLNHYDEKSNRFEFIALGLGNESKEQPPLTITAIAEDLNGILWIGTKQEGLFSYNLSTNEVGHYQHDPRYRDSLVKNNISDIFRDESGIFWIATYGGGLNKFEPERPKFLRYSHDPYSKNNLSASDVLAIFEDNNGILWLGTDGGGLNRFDPTSGNYTHYKQEKNNPNSLQSDSIYSIQQDKAGLLWLGTYGGGLNCFNPGTGEFKAYTIQPGRPVKYSNGMSRYISSNLVLPVLIDRNDIIWIGTVDGGLNRFNPSEGMFFHYMHNPEYPESISFDKIYTLYLDRANVLWIGTAGGGLNRMDNENGKFTCFQPSINAPDSLSDSTILCIYEDQGGILWVGTTAGLNRMDKDTRRFKTYKMADGLPSDVINAILEDPEKNLWISTNRGLSKFSPGKNIFRNYNVTDGVQDYEFNMGSAFKNKNGKLYFGGISGFNAFFPNQIKDTWQPPKIVFTSFKIFNQEAKLDMQISEIREIEISYKESLISFEFAALNYSDPPRNQYAIKLEGHDIEWNPLGNRRDITYTGLGHGEYKLWVKGSDNNLVWNETGTCLKIRVLPPFWKTWWFVTLIVFLFAALLGMVIRYRFKKFEYKLHLEKQQEKLDLKQQLEKKQLENELKLKADFTAMLVHDLRSPLTAIMGYADLLSSSPEAVDPVKIGGTISRSSDRMLNLINDMLDISKFEAGKMKINKKKVSLVGLVRDLATIMRPLFDKKSIQLKSEFPQIPRLFMDPEKIGQVVDNLISNAIKFSPPNSTITIRIRELTINENPYQEFSITDLGPGVPKEKRDFLFDKYAQFQSTPGIKGTGLGLAVSYLIIEAHGGKIGYLPEDGVCHTFFFQLPETTSQKSKVINFNGD